MLIDSHAHLTSSPLLGELDLLLERAEHANIEAIINVCTDAASLEMGWQLARREPWIYNAAAVHPHDAVQASDGFFAQIAEAARSGSLIAIGETGLDYHYQHAPRELQKLFFQRHLTLAIESSLPTIIHCREAFADLFSLLDAHYIIQGKHAPAVVHCFTGNRDEAREVVQRGLLLSFSGIITFKKSEQLREMAAELPLDSILIETDSPYLAPQSRRGATNEPAFIVDIAAALAAVRGISLQTIAQATTANARRLFRLNSTSG